jgi:hypothetical protein
MTLAIDGIDPVLVKKKHIDMKYIMYETHDFHNNSAHSWLYMYVMFGILLDC